ncbi:terminase small subunit [Bacillus atrophaeus]|uniref:terminase small subunit n=1 Tax=Bacillus atrophaeus TaxID=1452 RepID=UPI0022807B19|nr:terminase small subunit [Bacillus atrophaeus]MCY8813665.1 terminase small subunit [Bacillus atrophaeus]MCY8820262.1 terminase small subunit [Bacillus atrophaeus]MCY8828614.1 terminase small subunit [Bacillus atrophaeus]MCY8832701.1 terminase small subunit [Bacillus atrophaeus]MEC0749765.1 terminase small subunit [Bacillus atrophaeus]
MANWKDIRNEFETSNITLKALAEKYDIKIGTLKSRKSREGWSRNLAKKDATKNKKVATLEPVIESSNLTDKQELFCLYYIKYFNATKAYQKAYGCAYSTAMVEGHRHLRNPKIATEVERLKAEQQQGIFLDAKDILQKYIDIAFADITDYAVFGKKEIQATGAFGPVEDDDGNPVMIEINYVDFKESEEVDGTLVTEVKKGKDGVSIKLADKMKALEMLTKYYDLLSENDKKRLQEEKIRMDIEKTKKDIDGDNGSTQENEVAAMLRKMVKPHGT